MLTKQARQFEQWADERDRLMAKKAKQALKHHNEVKHRSALILTGLSMIGLTYSLIMICLTSDIDWLIVFNVFALSSGIGLLGLRK